MNLKKKVIMFHSFKGGTGKTILATNFAYYFAKRANYRVLIIDADLNAPSFDQIIPTQVEKIKTWVDYIDGKERLEKVIYPTNIENIDVIYSPASFKSKKVLLNDQNWWYKALQKALAIRTTGLKELNYDIVIIDNQSGISPNAANNISICDMGFLVIRPVSYSIWGTMQLIGDLYNVLQKLWNRKFYLIWNQVPHHEEISIQPRIDEWSQYFKDRNIKTIAQIDYDSRLAIEMLLDPPKTDKFIGVYDTIQDEIKRILQRFEKD